MPGRFRACATRGSGWGTPATVPVVPGRHTIAVKTKGYVEWSRTMNVSGSGVRVSVEMDVVAK